MEFSLEQLPMVADQIITKMNQVSSQDHAVLVTFSGDLGAGKTTLIKEIAKQLGVVDDLQSPTYVIYKRYVLSSKSLIHGDMYRLESVDEIVKLGWNELLADPKNILLIEWPEKVAAGIPDWAIRVVLRHKNGERRSIDIGI